MKEDNIDMSLFDNPGLDVQCANGAYWEILCWPTDI